jgi:Protein of unknown function (DUF1254)
MAVMMRPLCHGRLHTDNFAYLGGRTIGNGGGEYLLVGPEWHGAKPDGINEVTRPTPIWWSRPLVRRGLDTGGWVVEVEAAGAIEGFFGGADGVSAGQDGVFVAVAAGEMDREAPAVG